MRKIVGLVLVLNAGSFVPAVWSNAPPLQETVVRQKKGTPLEDLAPRGAPVVTVTTSRPRPHLVQPPAGVGQLEWMTSVASFVLVIRVNDLNVSLRSTRDWLTTTVTATVTDVLKQPEKATVTEGESIQFLQDGGEMVIRGTKFTADLPWTSPITQGTYLVFAEFDPQKQNWIVNPETAYAIDPSQVLRSLARPHDSNGRVERESIPLETGLARIKAAIKRDVAPSAGRNEEAAK